VLLLSSSCVMVAVNGVVVRVVIIDGTMNSKTSYDEFSYDVLSFNFCLIVACCLCYCCDDKRGEETGEARGCGRHGDLQCACAGEHAGLDGRERRSIQFGFSTVLNVVLYRPNIAQRLAQS
jgi:hypothetical protein